LQHRQRNGVFEEAHSAMENKRFGEILVDLKVLSRPEVDRVLQAMRCRRDQRKFGQVARDMGMVRDEHILAALAVQMELIPGISRMSLRSVLGQLQQPVTVTSPAPASARPSRRPVSRRAGF